MTANLYLLNEILGCCYGVPAAKETFTVSLKNREMVGGTLQIPFSGQVAYDVHSTINRARDIYRVFLILSALSQFSA